MPLFFFAFSGIWHFLSINYCTWPDPMLLISKGFPVWSFLCLPISTHKNFIKMSLALFWQLLLASHTSSGVFLLPNTWLRIVNDNRSSTVKYPWAHSKEKSIINHTGKKVFWISLKNNSNKSRQTPLLQELYLSSLKNSGMNPVQYRSGTHRTRTKKEGKWCKWWC